VCAFAAALSRAFYQWAGYKHCGNPGQGKYGHNSARTARRRLKRTFEIDLTQYPEDCRAYPPP
jgi:hypothetical protein